MQYAIYHGMIASVVLGHHLVWIERQTHSQTQVGQARSREKVTFFFINNIISCFFIPLLGFVTITIVPPSLIILIILHLKHNLKYASASNNDIPL